MSSAAVTSYKIAEHLPTAVEIIKTLLATRGRLRTQQLYALGLLGWPSETVTNPLPPQPLHVLNDQGEIRMRRAYNVRGGMAPFRPMPVAPYPDHPFQSVKFFKNRILTMMEERDLIRKIEHRTTFMTPTDLAEAHAKALKITRRRQRALAETQEVGLGKGFRLKKAERKIWEAQVYSLEVEKVEPETTRKEWVWEVAGLDVEREMRLLEEAGLGNVQPVESRQAVEPGAKRDPGLVDRANLTPSSSTIPPPPDLLDTTTLETALSDPTSIPTHLRADPLSDPPHPLVSPATDPLVQTTSIILSQPTIISRWQTAIQAEKMHNQAIQAEKEETRLRKQARRDMYKGLREKTKQFKEDRMRRELEVRPELRERVKRVYGESAGGVWTRSGGRLDEGQAGRERRDVY